jgi:hypothetical protein
MCIRLLESRQDNTSRQQLIKQDIQNGANKSVFCLGPTQARSAAQHCLIAPNGLDDLLMANSLKRLQCGRLHPDGTSRLPGLLSVQLNSSPQNTAVRSARLFRDDLTDEHDHY